MSAHSVDPDLLRSLAFLAGRFRGEGMFAARDLRFAKEVAGDWEVGGRFLSLRMTAIYRASDGEEDVHHAMVVVGVNPKTRAAEAVAFTDGGLILPYTLAIEAGRVSFADRLPHEVKGARARKTLVPTPFGYEETLEIDRGDARFEPWSRIELRRVAG